MGDSEQIQITITGSGEEPQDLADQIEAIDGGRAMVANRDNLSGSASEWMMIASVGASLLPHIVDLLKTYLSSREPEPHLEVVLGDITIKNPPPEMASELIDEAIRRSREGG